MPTKKRNTGKVTSKTQIEKFPLPPGPEASCEEIDEYFSKYSLSDLEKTGQARQLNAEEKAWMRRLSSELADKVKARKRRSAQLNLAMSQEQLARFNQLAKRKHIPPSTLARAWILERLDSESKEA